MQVIKFVAGAVLAGRVLPRDAGYRLRDAEQSQLAIARVRSSYAALLNAWALYWMTPPAQWIGDRAPIRHHLHPSA